MQGCKRAALSWTPRSPLRRGAVLYRQQTPKPALKLLSAALWIIEREAHGFHARVVQHECDHLDGILYPQRMEDLSKLIFETEFRHHIKEAAP